LLSRFDCAAQAGGNRRDDPLPLLYEDEKLVDLQVVFGSPHLPAEPIQLGALAANFAAAVTLR
jgi:hypothetical protein